MTAGAPALRHDLVRPRAAAIAGLVAAAPADAADGLALWLEAGRPLIVRRRQASDPPDCVPVAVRLPDARRLAATLRPADIEACDPPPTLGAVVARLPEAWRGPARALATLGASLGVAPRVFGGALWQHLTGAACLHAGSDLDLLWPVGRRGEAETCARAAALLARLGPFSDMAPRLDGEILFDDGAGVQWRELAAAPRHGTVLLKTADGVSLVAAAGLLGASAPCPA